MGRETFVPAEAFGSEYQKYRKLHGLTQSQLAERLYITAHNMVMNMLTTCAMVKTGRVYENMMVNLKPYNIKLRQRVINIVCDICGCDRETAVEQLDATDWDIRSAAERYRSPYSLQADQASAPK